MTEPVKWLLAIVIDQGARLPGIEAFPGLGIQILGRLTSLLPRFLVVHESCQAHSTRQFGPCVGTMLHSISAVNDDVTTAIRERDVITRIFPNFAR